MEYKKDKRTKNLTLRDIHVGDWVQVWSEQTERYSPPLKIISIHDDGTIYLVTSDEERCTPWEEDVKNVDALELEFGASYGWNGSSCPYKPQRKFIAETYYLYREIYHQIVLEKAKHMNMSCNVYLDETLTCDESGEPIKVERVE